MSWMSQGRELERPNQKPSANINKKSNAISLQTRYLVQTQALPKSLDVILRSVRVRWDSAQCICVANVAGRLILHCVFVGRVYSL